VRACNALLALLLGAPGEARPARIVSTNPCIDSVLVRVADGPQVAAISHWSHDPAAGSLPLAVARRFPAHGGTAEELIAARPDLVLLTPFTPLATRAALARLGVPTLSLGVPATIADSLAQVQQVADAAGHGGRGRALVAEIEAGLAKARRPGTQVPALMRMGSGFVPGPGSLSEALMAHAGLLSLSRGYGLERAGVIPLEVLALKPPPLLLTDRANALHPVVAKLPTRVAPFDRRLLNCGGPTMVAAAVRLAAIRDGRP
jgi:iron complex transport system substrate-binding protein